MKLGNLFLLGLFFVMGILFLESYFESRNKEDICTNGRMVTILRSMVLSGFVMGAQLGDWLEVKLRQMENIHKHGWWKAECLRGVICSVTIGLLNWPSIMDFPIYFLACFAAFSGALMTIQGLYFILTFCRCAYYSATCNEAG
jgi:hypothetical protein